MINMNFHCIKIIQILIGIKNLFRINKWKRFFKVWSKTKRDRVIIKRQLRTEGWNGIRSYSIGSWKYYNDDCLRVTFSACKDRRKYIIKIAKGFENKIRNSIKFQELFQNEFDFIPKGREIKLDGYVAYITEYLDCFPFKLGRYCISINNVGGT
ncbi:MAG: hypothetical protein Q4E60_11315 [Bacteroidales bacterium]|nr:hypothetical protein [Bacteroidales bacterium]